MKLLVFFECLYLACIATIPMHAQACAPTLEAEIGEQALYSGANFFLVDFDPEVFPDVEVDPGTGQSVQGIRSAIEHGVASGMTTWNNSCRGSVANHFPAMIPDNGLLGNSIPLSIKYNPGRNPESRDCPWSGTPQPRCAAPAVTRSYKDPEDPSRDRVEITIYRYFGDISNLSRTFLAHHGFEDMMLTHELGHAFGLEHNRCPGSFMDGTSALFDNGPKAVHEEECDLLQDAYEPPDPLGFLEMSNRCLFNDYCTSDERSWPLDRTVCGWLRYDVPTSIDDGEVIITTTTRVQEYVCLPIGINPLGGEEGVPWPPPTFPQFHRGPRLLLARPNPEEVISEPVTLRGWAWEGQKGIQQVAVFLDGQPFELDDFSYNVYSPEVCNSGIDPINCDPFGGFSGIFNPSGLTPGHHVLDVVATNERSPDPLAGSIRRTIIVGETTQDDPPVAVDDEATTVIHLSTGEGEPVTITVTANDHAPDGSRVRLKAQPIVLAPSFGTVFRWSDDEIVYTPTTTSAKTDLFKYEIVDGSGRVARGRVIVTIRLASP